LKGKVKSFFAVKTPYAANSNQLATCFIVLFYSLLLCFYFSSIFQCVTHVNCWVCIDRLGLTDESRKTPLKRPHSFVLFQVTLSLYFIGSGNKHAIYIRKVFLWTWLFIGSN